ncbi:MAG: lipid II:glycine glycyltransferase FemX [Myxococcota bacterium]
MRPVHIEPLVPDLEARWEKFATESASAGIYHSLAWREVALEGLGHVPEHLCAVDARGEVCGILPIFRVGGIFGRRLVSVPMRDRGGPIAASDGIAQALVAAAIDRTRELGARYLELRGLEPLSPEILGEHPWRLSRGWLTHRLDLTPGRDALWKALDKNSLRWSIGRARRNGLRVETDSTRAGADRFHDLFVRTRCSMGIPPFPRALFRAIWAHLIQHERAQLCFVYRDGAPIHGLISFFSGDTFIPAYAAPQNAHRKLYGNELLIWHSIEWAADRGFRSYDFGADSVRQEGLHFFKRKWRAVPHPMAYHSLHPRSPDGGAPPDFDSSGPGYRALRALWQRLPRALARPLGAWVTRQLS